MEPSINRETLVKETTQVTEDNLLIPTEVVMANLAETTVATDVHNAATAGASCLRGSIKAATTVNID
jgi:hypothetical protein